MNTTPAEPADPVDVAAISHTVRAILDPRTSTPRGEDLTTAIHDLRGHVGLLADDDEDLGPLDAQLRFLRREAAQLLDARDVHERSYARQLAVCAEVLLRRWCQVRVPDPVEIRPEADGCGYYLTPNAGRGAAGRHLFLEEAYAKATGQDAGTPRQR